MDKPQIQIILQSSPERIFRALTETLPEWFAEYADVSIAEKRYDFWGRFTPEAPDRDAGKHGLHEGDLSKGLKYDWVLGGRQTTVEIRLHPRGDQQMLVVHHEELNPTHTIDHFTTEDFWFLSLENLRRHLDGKAPVRCDFSASMRGDIQHTVEIQGSREAVFEKFIKPEELNRWIASNAVVEPYVGGKYDFGWEGAGPVKILELKPNEKIAYSWPERGFDTIVTWTLEESGGKTRLTLVHSGFAPDTENGGLYTGWLNFASWVKSMVEYGASWQAPILRLRPGTEAFYAKAIGDGQTELV